MEHTSRRAESEENEFVSPKECFSKSFPCNKTFCLHFQNFIANIYSAEYHKKTKQKENFGKLV